MHMLILQRLREEAAAVHHAWSGERSHLHQRVQELETQLNTATQVRVRHARQISRKVHQSYPYKGRGKGRSCDTAPKPAPHCCSVCVKQGPTLHNTQKAVGQFACLSSYVTVPVSSREQTLHKAVPQASRMCQQ